MRFFNGEDRDGGLHRIELTRRNLTTLLDKLDQPDSARTLIDPDRKIEVVAVPDVAHYLMRPPGPVVDTRTGRVS